MNEDNPYEILGLSSDATDDEIKKAYRREAKRWHPDARPGDAEAARRFALLSRAYDTLSSPEKKEEYDSRLRPWGPEEWGENYSIEDVISDFFGSRKVNVYKEVSSDEIKVRVPGDVLDRGGKIRVPYRGEKLSVRVPKNTKSGSKLRLRGYGASGGDLLLYLERS